MKKIMVTGISGFIGHHVNSLLQKKDYFVVGVDWRPIRAGHSVPERFIQTDVGNLTYRDLMGIDYVIHLAFSTNIGDSVRHPIRSTRDNINSTIHLLEYAKDAKVNGFLFPSTCALYSHNPTPWTEDTPLMPIEPYSWQKLACEYACQMYTRAYGLPTAIVRLFQVYGEGQREDTVISTFLKAKKENKRLPLMETRDQSKHRSGQRDFIYAGDVAEAMVTIMEKRAFDTYNVCSGKVVTIEEIAKAIGTKTKWVPGRPYEVDRHHGDNTKLKKLGWKPRTEVIKWLNAECAMAQNLKK